MLPRDRGQPGERVDGARAHRARVPDEQERVVPLAAVLLDPALERRDVDRQVVSHGDPAEAGGPEAEEVGRLLEPGVGLGRGVGEEPRAVAVHARLADTLARLRPPRGEEADEVRHVAPAHEEPLAPGGHPEEAGQPPDALALDLGGDRRELPRAHVGVDRGRQQVGQSPDRRRRGRDVAEEARVPVEERVVEEERGRLGEQVSRRRSLVLERGGEEAPAARSAPRPESPADRAGTRGTPAISSIRRWPASRKASGLMSSGARRSRRSSADIVPPRASPWQFRGEGEG